MKFKMLCNVYMATQKFKSGELYDSADVGLSDDMLDDWVKRGMADTGDGVKQAEAEQEHARTREREDEDAEAAWVEYVLSGNLQDVAEAVDDCNNTSMLQKLLDAEREGSNRKGAVANIERRMEELLED